jgi:hypothetical protein
VDDSSFTKTAPRTPTGQPAEVRIGDAERQAAARQLQQHFADGRLTWEELDERLAVAYAARGNAQLVGLFSDLPMLAPPPPPPAPPRSRFQSAAARLGSIDLRRLVLLAIAASIAIWVTHGIVVPVVLLWWITAGRHRHHGRRRDHHRRHHRGNAWS